MVGHCSEDDVQLAYRDEQNSASNLALRWTMSEHLFAACQMQVYRDHAEQNNLKNC